MWGRYVECMVWIKSTRRATEHWTETIGNYPTVDTKWHLLGNGSKADW